MNELIDFDEQYLLNEEEEKSSQLEPNFTTLKSSVCTRWNSILKILRSFILYQLITH